MVLRTSSGNRFLKTLMKNNWPIHSALAERKAATSSCRGRSERNVLTVLSFCVSWIYWGHQFASCAWHGSLWAALMPTISHRATVLLAFMQSLQYASSATDWSGRRWSLSKFLTSLVVFASTSSQPLYCVTRMTWAHILPDVRCRQTHLAKPRLVVTRNRSAKARGRLLLKLVPKDCAPIRYSGHDLGRCIPRT